jgi:hypothetical protein
MPPYISMNENFACKKEKEKYWNNSREIVLFT